MLTYKTAGVDINAGNELVGRIKKMAPWIGGFSGTFPVNWKKYQQPLLVSSADGVGTKLKIAFSLNQHKTVGIDLVAMNVNDVLCCGAEPLFFLDYYACGKLDVDQAEQVIQGIVNGCKIAGCILLGGETAEMPGFYRPGEYDLAGFAVGIVDKKKLIDGKKIKPGDIVAGIPSSGVHSNGFSLVRRIFNEMELKKYGKDFLTPTRIYCKDVLPIVKKHPGVVKGIVHVTGGGYYDNIPRILPKNCRVIIDQSTWDVPEIFNVIRICGNVSDYEMYRTFNMGIGMILVLDAGTYVQVKKKIQDLIKIGVVEKGPAGVELI